MSTLPRARMPRAWQPMPFLDEFLRHSKRRMSLLSRQPTVVRTSIFRTSTLAVSILTMPVDWDMCSLESEGRDSFLEFSDVGMCP